MPRILAVVWADGARAVAGGGAAETMQPDLSRDIRAASAATSGGLEPYRLALCGLPAALAEPVAMIADILGWDVVTLPPGPAMRPPADLCLAMLPVDGAAPLPPIAVWSPNKNLNEHISHLGLSILEQPPCIQQLERLLQIAADLP